MDKEYKGVGVEARMEGKAIGIIPFENSHIYSDIMR